MQLLQLLTERKSTINRSWIVLLLVLWVHGTVLIPRALAQSDKSGDMAELTGTLVFQTVSGGPIYVVNADGTELRYLTTGMDPAISPDGEQVAFTRRDFPHGLYVIKVDGTGERQLFGTSQVKAPAWSPDGASIAFTYQHGGHTDDWSKTIKVRIPGAPKKIEIEFAMPANPHWKIGVVSVADGYFREMYSHDFSYSPTWSPDGTRIAYTSDRGLALTWEDATSAVTRVPNTGSLSDHWEVDRSPAWSPDGTRIAFQYRSHDHYEIMVMNADGSGRTLLTKSPALAKTPINSVSPAWSPAGSQIAFLSDRSGQWDIWVMNADGSDQRLMFPPGTLGGLKLEYHNVDERVLSWR